MKLDDAVNAWRAVPADRRISLLDSMRWQESVAAMFQDHAEVETSRAAIALLEAAAEEGE